MKSEYIDIELNNNSAKKVFEMQLGDQLAFVKYSNDNDENKIFLLHTEVPENMEGKGAGAAIVEKVFYYLENIQMKVIPLCPFIIAYLKRHPEWNRIVDKR